ncbi:hypothetical protein [Mesonia sp.]|uniref:hypothetical protein n=1 Tax=Mesonia sp. TaxID=1960830 RepID=UPI003F946E55
MILSPHLKQRLSIVFLLAFVSLKAGALHSLVHADDINDTQECVWCHLSATDKHTPIIAAEDFHEISPLLLHHIANEVQITYRSLASTKTPVCLIFNKPPPFFTA